jgi:cytochrome b involved in lipid metabolism
VIEKTKYKTYDGHWVTEYYMTIPYEVWSEAVLKAQKEQTEFVTIKGIDFELSEFDDFEAGQDAEFDWIE